MCVHRIVYIFFESKTFLSGQVRLRSGRRLLISVELLALTAQWWSRDLFALHTIQTQSPIMPCSDCNPAFTALAKLTECKLVSRLRSNRIPIAPERVELTELVSHAEKEILRYDQAIARLQKLIACLENDRERLKDEIKIAKSLLAPIRKLTPDILRQVFIAHGTSNILRPKPGKTTIPGFLVASICSHWRSVAIKTLRLWSNISIKMQKTPHLFWQAELVHHILILSGESKLDIAIFVMPGVAHPACISLLCKQAHRWQSLAGSIVPGTAALDVYDPLSDVQGRLKSLKTSTILVPFRFHSKWIEGASELYKARVLDIDPTQITTRTPWNRIVDLEIDGSHPSHIIQSLRHFRSLRSLQVTYPCYRQDPNPVQQQVRSDLRSLTLLLRQADHKLELQMATFLDMLIVPKLDSLSIISNDPTYITNQGGISWSSRQLPSLISRSSASITSFSLDRAWVPTNDLLALLNSMPSLISLFLREPSYPYSDIVPSMLQNELLSNLDLNQNLQPILPRLISLTLEECQLASDFSVSLFVKVIQSRWKPSMDNVACIKTVRLTLVDGLVSRRDLPSLVMLRKRGLDISVEDVDGEVPLSEEK